MIEMVTRKEAIELGLTVGRLNYLCEQGCIKKSKNEQGLVVFDKASVLKYAKTQARTPVHPRDPFDRRKTKKLNTLEIAFIAVGICAQLMKNESIKAKFKGASVSDLLATANAIKMKLER